MQQQRAFLFVIFSITQQLVQTDRVSYEHCNNEGEELPR
jgi:hypothetical protein